MGNSQTSQSVINIDPLRLRLEKSLIKARWFATLGLFVLTLGAQFGLNEAVLLLVFILSGNCFVIVLTKRSRSINSQRITGFIATLVDSTIALIVIFVAPSALGPSIYAILVLVAVETAVRYAPLKGLILTLFLSASLVIVVTLRHSTERAGDINFGLMVFWAGLIVGIGLFFGTIIREIYRQRFIPESVQQMIRPNDFEILTPREVDVFKLISSGYSNQEIAEELVIELKTVKNHINNMYSKLNMSSRYQAISRSFSAQGFRDQTGKEDLN